MITSEQVPALLQNEIPTLANKEYPSKTYLKIYAAINYFSDYTLLMIEKKDKNMIDKCLALAEKLYKEGDGMVKLLIKNSFVYHLIKNVLGQSQPHKEDLSASHFILFFKELKS
jgi:hypothetical protein